MRPLAENPCQRPHFSAHTRRIPANGRISRLNPLTTQIIGLPDARAAGGGAPRPRNVNKAERPLPLPGKLFAKRSLRGEGGAFPRSGGIRGTGHAAPRRRPYITFVDSSLRSIHSVSLSAGLLSPRPTTSETTT